MAAGAEIQGADGTVAIDVDGVGQRPQGHQADAEPAEAVRLVGLETQPWGCQAEDIPEPQPRSAVGEKYPGAGGITGNGELGLGGSGVIGVLDQLGQTLQAIVTELSRIALRTSHSLPDRRGQRIEKMSELANRLSRSLGVDRFRKIRCVLGRVVMQYLLSRSLRLRLAEHGSGGPAGWYRNPSHLNPVPAAGRGLHDIRRDRILGATGNRPSSHNQFSRQHRA